MNLVYAFIYGLIAQIISFVAIQGSYKYTILKNNSWIPVLMGIPVSYLLIKSVHHFIEAFHGEIWPSRLIGQSIGVATFSVMGWFMFQEKMTMKTIICLTLAFCIVFIQIYWKTPKI
jgi:multidrug transporter EmrE-like cation transporter